MQCELNNDLSSHTRCQWGKAETQNTRDQVAHSLLTHDFQGRDSLCIRIAHSLSTAPWKTHTLPFIQTYL